MYMESICVFSMEICFTKVSRLQAVLSPSRNLPPAAVERKTNLFMTQSVHSFMRADMVFLWMQQTCRTSSYFTWLISTYRLTKLTLNVLVSCGDSLWTNGTTTSLRMVCASKPPFLSIQVSTTRTDPCIYIYIYPATCVGFPKVPPNQHEEKPILDANNPWWINWWKINQYHEMSRHFGRTTGLPSLSQTIINPVFSSFLVVFMLFHWLLRCR